MSWLERLRQARDTRRLVRATYHHLLPPPPEAFARFGPGSYLVPPLRVHQPQFMEVGRDVVVLETGFLSAEVGPDGRPPRLVIGDRATLSAGCTVAAVDEVVIGADCLMAARVFIGDASHAFEDPATPIQDQGMTSGRPVHVGEGSFLGIGTVVLPGTRIGRGVMVGAGSVVSGELPDHTVVVGNPARVVRRYVDGRGWVRVEPDGD